MLGNYVVFRGPLIISGATYKSGEVIPDAVWYALAAKHQKAFLDTGIVTPSKPSVYKYFANVKNLAVVVDGAAINFKSGQEIDSKTWFAVPKRTQYCLVNTHQVKAVVQSPSATPTIEADKPLPIHVGRKKLTLKKG